MTTDSGSWWHVGPKLAEQGYRVVAPDLPGHGRSGRGEYTLGGMADTLIDAVPHAPALAIGHSLGGLVLAAAVDRLEPARAVYEDPPWGTPPGPQVAAFLASQQGWSVEQFAAFHPRWSADAVREKHRALSLWDPATMDVVREYPGPRTVPPEIPSLVVIGDVEPMIDESLATQLRCEGYRVRVVEGAGHNVHDDDPETFQTTLDGPVFGAVADATATPTRDS
jgi:pimeloyl-ACP methyl ester carboxylesterase